MTMPDCSIRYELDKFYNETRLMELQVLPPLPPPPSPPGRNGNNGFPTDNPRGKKRSATKKVVIISVSVCVCVALAVCAVIYLRKRMTRRSRSWEIIETIQEINTVESLQYDLGDIRAATADFDDSNKLGQGGFGAVYRGKLQDGQEIAVKRLSKNSGQGNTEFKNEVLLVARLQHRNLVRLLGFSLEGTERLLVYEFVQNANLDQFIFDPIKRSRLDWDMRHKIIGGVARGLVYLHEDSRLRIIHRDLKAGADGRVSSTVLKLGGVKKNCYIYIPQYPRFHSPLRVCARRIRGRRSICCGWVERKCRNGRTKNGKKVQKWRNEEEEREEREIG